MLAPHLLARVQAAASGRRFRTGDQSPWVHTTVDKDVQVRGAEILERHHRAMAENGVWNAAALVLEVETGDAVAYLGNLSPENDDSHGEHVDVVKAPRSTGSIL